MTTKTPSKRASSASQKSPPSTPVTRRKATTSSSSASNTPSTPRTRTRVSKSRLGSTSPSSSSSKFKSTGRAIRPSADYVRATLYMITGSFAAYASYTFSRASHMHAGIAYGLTASACFLGGIRHSGATSLMGSSSSFRLPWDRYHEWATVLVHTVGMPLLVLDVFQTSWVKSMVGTRPFLWIFHSRLFYKWIVYPSLVPALLLTSVAILMIGILEVSAYAKFCSLLSCGLIGFQGIRRRQYELVAVAALWSGSDLVGDRQTPRLWDGLFDWADLSICLSLTGLWLLKRFLV